MSIPNHLSTSVLSLAKSEENSKTNPEPSAAPINFNSSKKYRVGLHGSLDVGSQGYIAAFLGPFIPLVGGKLGTVIDGKNFGAKFGGVFKAGPWNSTFVEGGIYARFLAHQKDPRYSFILGGGISGGQGLGDFIEGHTYLKPDFCLGFEWRRFKQQESTLSLAVLASGLLYIFDDPKGPGVAGLANVHLEIGFDFYHKKSK